MISTEPEKKAGIVYYDHKCELCKFSEKLLKTDKITKISMQNIEFENSSGLVLKESGGEKAIGFKAKLSICRCVKLLFPMRLFLFM